MNKALTYAEQQLRVHQVHEQALELVQKLDDLVTELDKAQDSKRALTEKIADREADLLIEERGKHASMSATALDQHMKTQKRKDPQLSELRERLNLVLSEVSGMEYDEEILKTRIRIAVARIEELGGYFRYLAATKEAETLAKHAKPTQPTKQEKQ